MYAVLLYNNNREVFSDRLLIQNAVNVCRLTLWENLKQLSSLYLFNVQAKEYEYEPLLKIDIA